VAFWANVDHRTAAADNEGAAFFGQVQPEAGKDAKAFAEAKAHCVFRTKSTPSNRVLPKYPLLIRHVTKASQRPVVGSALNWQGQPQLQLQLANSSPAIRHLIFVGSLIFLLFNMLLLLVEGCHVQIGFR
jgi:hypothetical protein